MRHPLVTRGEADEIVRVLRMAGIDALVAGSVRRLGFSEHDLDLVVISSREEFEEAVKSVPALGLEFGSGGDAELRLLMADLPIDIWFAIEDNVGSMMLHATGSKNFNITCRAVAKRKGLLLNQYGVFRGKERIAGSTEAGCLAAIGRSWHDPSDRE